jgi:CSLREA domain-containing protein
MMSPLQLLHVRVRTLALVSICIVFIVIALGWARRQFAVAPTFDSGVHAPNVTNATTNEDTQTTSGLVITRNALDGPEVTFFKITNVVGGTLFKNDGVTQIPINTFITAAEGNAGLKFTPAPNGWGTFTIAVRSSISNTDAGLGGFETFGSITVNPVADTPSVTNATTNRSTQTHFGLVLASNPVDGFQIGYAKITNIQNGKLFKHDGTTPINSGDFITFQEGGAGLRFTPTNGLISPSTTFSFDIQASTANSDAGLGGDVITASINVVDPIFVTVNSSGDDADSNPGDGHCDTDGNLANGDQCTLRAAIEETNAAPGADTISFNLPAGSVITLNSALPDLNSVNIVGPGANNLTVQRSTAGGTPEFRIFNVKSTSTLYLSGLTLANGKMTLGTFPANSGGAIMNNGNLVLSDSIISGNTGGNGGGVANFLSATITNTTISGNNTSGGAGGGIYTNTPGSQAPTLTITGSTISNNTGGSGGGLASFGGTVTVSNSTISTNNATSGGGLNNVTPVTLNSVTITANSATNNGGGITSPGIGAMTMTNSIVYGNTSPSAPDINGANITADYNIVGNTSGWSFGSVNHNLLGVNPLLGPLTNNGGATKTHALLAGSPAIDAGYSTVGIDQRGQARPIDDPNIANAVGGNGSDIGAYEAPTLEVNTTADTDDGPCTLVGIGNGCTLREAINAANLSSGQITFAASVTSGGPATIDLLTALPAINGNVSITGPGSNLLTIERGTAGGTPDFRIFLINQGKSLTISGLSVAKGKPNALATFPFNLGANFLNDHGTLTINNCIVSNAVAGRAIVNYSGVATISGTTVSGNGGGGLYNTMPQSAVNSPALVTINNSAFTGNIGTAITNMASVGTSSSPVTMVVTNSTISGNTIDAGGSGAAIQNSSASGGIATMSLINATISGNTGTGSGGVGGIYNIGIFGGGPTAAAKVTLTNCTVFGNSANAGSDAAGGMNSIINSCPGCDVSIKLRNSLVAGNTVSGSPSDIVANPAVDASSAFNLIGTGGSGGMVNGTNGNQVGVATPGLGPLADNGGPTQTHALLSTSPALDAGDNCVTQATHCGDSSIAQLTTDQRGNGFSRIVDGPDADTTATVDIGAFEQQATLGALTDQTTSEDIPVAVSFDIGDPAQLVSVSATSDNGVLVPNLPANLSFSGPASSSTRTLTITPAANLFGTANITITLNTTGGTTTKTFLLTVLIANDAPSFTVGPNQIVNEDSGAQTVFNWATNISPGPADESSQTVTFQITNNSNASLFSAGPTVSATGALTYTPAANANGTAIVTIVAKDNGGTANGGSDTSGPQTFTITVNPVNDAPSFTRGANQTFNEDAGAQTVVNWATGISAGPPDESGQTLIFQIVNNSNAALFSAGPAISSAGTLTYTPAANANGSATITINLKDNGGTANSGVDTSPSQSFTITINSVNDPPSFTKGPDILVNNNAGQQSLPAWATNISPGPGNESTQTVVFQVLGNTNPVLFSAGPTITSAGTLVYIPNPNAGGTATITINLKDNGGTANGGVDTSPSQSFTITVNPAGGFINFASSTGNTTENSGSTTVNVMRTGDTSRAVTVNYATNGDAGVPCSTANGIASPKCDFTAALGTLNFAAGETSKPITILISQDSFVEGPEVITLTLANPTGGSALGTPASIAITIADDASEPATNIIDDPNLFVRMHYHDFLNREADQSGLDFWTGQMTNCGAADLTVCRVNVSGAFFLSIEFQQTGYLVERMYKVAYGDATGTSSLNGSHQVFVPVIRANEFLADTQRVGRGVVVLQPGWEQVLENNKQAYALEFVQTSRFITALPTTMTPAQFVDKLNQNAGNVLSPSDRTTAINLFGIAADTTNVSIREQVVRQIAEDPDLYNAEFNRAFVFTQYSGYLRRNPNDLPDSDYTGYEFWLNKLNQFNGDYIGAEMVKAFIASSEYRQRFGP